MLQEEKSPNAKYDLNGSTTTTEKVLTCEICDATFTKSVKAKRVM